MRLALTAAALLLSAAAVAAPPEVDMEPAHPWHQKAREIYERAISFQTVQGRNQSPELAAYLQEQFRAAGLTEITIHAYDDTASLVLRWPAARPSGRKAMLLMAHMDVVEARREDWSRDPFTLERGGRLFLRPRHARRQAGGDRDHHRLAAAARRGLPAAARHHRPVHRRRGDHRQRRGPCRQPVARRLDHRLRLERRRRRRRLPRGRHPARLLDADRREDLPELHLHRDQSRRPQLAAAARQRHLRARPHARAARAAPVRADAERHHPRLFRPSRRHRRSRARRRDPPLARRP